jgi:HlyD family secretion protein
MKRNRIALSLAALLVIAACHRNTPLVIEGEIEATDVDVSARIPGRVLTLAVREGSAVERGTVIATLESDEITAKLRQAEAARDAAAAQQAKADRGLRTQEIAQAKDAWLRAKTASALAAKTFGRIDRLNRDGVVPGQRRDEAEAQWQLAREAESIAKASYDMAREGARREDRDAARALVDRAGGAIDEVQAYAKERILLAPISGEVSKLNAEAGEMVGPGFAVATLTDLNDVWATFHVTEDRMASLGIGSTVQARIPALGGGTHAFRIDYQAPAGDYATVKPSNAAGGFDVKTFEVRARPAGTIRGLRPGMSVLVEIAR